ncbi:MAG TPA: acyl carrier protein [Candidatus Eisenbacteria bacterium]|nr:acyl carrier protein [Candidatus Eisenbacteria bacterium]
MNKERSRTEEPMGTPAGAPEDIQAWIIARLAEELKVPPGDIDVRLPFTQFGLDSIVAFMLTGELADRLGCDLPATLFWEYPTLESLAQYLHREFNDRPTPRTA